MLTFSALRVLCNETVAFLAEEHLKQSPRVFTGVVTTGAQISSLLDSFSGE